MTGIETPPTPATGWVPLRIPGEPPLAGSRTGAGPGPVISLHGITAHHRSFNAVARHLRHPDGMVALDLRGRGDSGKPASGYGFGTHASDVLRALDHLGIERAVLAGHSMGAFVVEEVALAAPDRVRALLLLDGGWPRVPAEDEAPVDPDLAAGLARAFSRLTMTFPSPDAYLDFWFPGQGLTIDRLPPDLADYYRYDLRKVGAGWQPKASLRAVTEDADWGRLRGPTAEELARIRCPVGLVRATEGFFPGSPPLIDEETQGLLARLLDVRAAAVLQGANHYTMLFEPYAGGVAAVIDQILTETASSR